MVDCFALLQEPRRPWIDLDRLKAKFLAYTAQEHPDRVLAQSEPERILATDRYTEINAAYNCLRNPKERLLHLLELELEAKPKDFDPKPKGSSDLFFQIGQECQNADELLAEGSGINAPLLKVRWFERALERIDQLNALKQSIEAKLEQIIEELKPLNAMWDSAPPIGSPKRQGALALERLEELYRAVGYLARWRERIQIRVVRLSLQAS